MYIAGSEVVVGSLGMTSDALVNGVDVFATIAAIAGVFDDAAISDLNDITGYGSITFDSVDLTPILEDYTANVRDWIFSEDWGANTDQVPNSYGQKRVIQGRFDDGTGNGTMGLYKLWVFPPKTPWEPEEQYVSNSYYVKDRFYELSIDDGDIITDEFEGANLINGDPQGMLAHQEAAYLSLRAEIENLVGF